jgi:hypothetical protein
MISEQKLNITCFEKKFEITREEDSLICLVNLGDNWSFSIPLIDLHEFQLSVTRPACNSIKKVRVFEFMQILHMQKSMSSQYTIL